MKILLVSDSHGDDSSLAKIASKHNDCDYYLHLGDSQSTPDRIRPFISVKGNCDYYSSGFQKFLILFSPYGKIYVEHIPFYQTNISKLKEEGFKIYLHGHTHVKRDETIDGVRIINPGSIDYPRDNSRSYALIDITDSNVNVKFFELD